MTWAPSRVVPIDGHNLAAALEALRTDFGRLSPVAPGVFRQPMAPITQADTTATPTDAIQGFTHLAAPPRLHVVAELLAASAVAPTSTEFYLVEEGGGAISAIILYIPNQLVILAGHPEAAGAVARPLRHMAWAILMGDEGLTTAALERWQRRMWWMPPIRVRRQLFMATTGPAVVRPGQDPAYRVATAADVDAVTDLAATLHVDDEMGPPLTPKAMASLRQRVADTITKGRTWVMDVGGTAVAKFDLHNVSPIYGAQLSGVVVHEAYRGQGLGTRLAANAIADLLHVGIPMVSLHVREGNVPAIRAYEKAGLYQVASQLMAIV